MLERVNLIRILVGNRLFVSLAAHHQQKKDVSPAKNQFLAHGVLTNRAMSCFSISGLTHSPTKNKGQIQVILGPMFSGKSTELMRRIQRYRVANHDCLIIKYAKDIRYSNDYIATHDKHIMLSAVKTERLMNVTIPPNCSVIGIDEGQFFPDIVDFCEKVANNGIKVVVAALDGTFQRKAFGSVLSLIPLAESVVKLSAVCMICYGEAAFTKRIGTETEVEVIGGTEKYMAVCRQCFKLQLDHNCEKENVPLGEINVNNQDATPKATIKNTCKKNVAPRQLLFKRS